MLKDKIIVIVGGNGLLGKKLIKEVLKHNAKVVAADISENNDQKSQEIDFIKIDICSKKSLESGIEYIQKKYGKIDAVVNTAYPRNKNYGRKFEQVNYEDFCENTNTHLGGYFLTSQCFAAFFKAQGFGNVINISSIYGVIAPQFEVYEKTEMTMPVEYAAIKSAIIHLTKYMAKYFKGSNIRFNCVSPGGIFDHQNPDFLAKYKKLALNKGMLDVEDVLGAIIFLLSDASMFINGQNIIVDDGWSL